jgi:GNAT superfamily N-acetyltransferase
MLSDELAPLIHTAFATNRETYHNYTREFLESCYEYPGLDPNLSPMVYEDGKLVASLSVFPRNVIYDGRDVKLALLTLNAVHPEYRSRGYGIRMVTEATRKAQAAGYDGGLFYCVEGNRANRTSVAGVESAGFPCQHVYTVGYLMGLVPSGEPSDVSPGRPALLQEMADDLASRVPLARSWREPEAQWQFRRFGAICECLETRDGVGILTGYIMPNADSGASLMIEDVLWGRLDLHHRAELLKRFLSRAAGRAEIAVVPLLNYADVSPFRSARFRQSTRKLNAYLSMWNGQYIPPRILGMYLDVF